MSASIAASTDTRCPCDPIAASDPDGPAAAIGRPDRALRGQHA